ncbi:MAG: phosphoribosyltransferase family protein [Candidatus Wallbacteria bacterium]|nr:phosphoribosyltransferase family protein [Candidatus Wallbacteria bacterium]
MPSTDSTFKIQNSTLLFLDLLPPGQCLSTLPDGANRTDPAGLLYRLKFRSEIACADELAAMMHNTITQPGHEFRAGANLVFARPDDHEPLSDGHCVKTAGFHVDLVVPVPATEQRPIQPAYEIAARLAELMGIPCLHALAKARAYPALKHISSPDERAHLIHGAIRVCDHVLVKGQRVLLLDDVVISGSTLQECSRALVEAGAAAVINACVLRR